MKQFTLIELKEVTKDLTVLYVEDDLLRIPGSVDPSGRKSGRSRRDCGSDRIPCGDENRIPSDPP